MLRTEFERAYTDEIASSMQEQGAATSEISQNVAMAADGSQSVAETISGVNAQVDDTKKSAEDVLGTARSVTEQAEELHRASTIS